MYAIWDTKRKAFKTYEGWTQYVKDKKGERIEGTADIIRFTDGEAGCRNTLPSYQRFVDYPGPISWEDFG